MPTFYSWALAFSPCLPSHRFRPGKIILSAEGKLKLGENLSVGLCSKLPILKKILNELILGKRPSNNCET